MYDYRKHGYSPFPNTPVPGHQFFPPHSGGGHQQGPPISPPPSYTPHSSQSVMAVDPGAISGCLYRYTYVWLRGWESFWFYPTYVGRRSISGYRWNGHRWDYYGVGLRRIKSFQCH